MLSLVGHGVGGNLPKRPRRRRATAAGPRLLLQAPRLQAPLEKSVTELHFTAFRSGRRGDLIAVSHAKTHPSRCDARVGRRAGPAQSETHRRSAFRHGDHTDGGDGKGLGQSRMRTPATTQVCGAGEPAKLLESSPCSNTAGSTFRAETSAALPLLTAVCVRIEALPAVVPMNPPCAPVTAPAVCQHLRA